MKDIKEEKTKPNSYLDLLCSLRFSWVFAVFERLSAEKIQKEIIDKRISGWLTSRLEGGVTKWLIPLKG